MFCVRPNKFSVCSWLKNIILLCVFCGGDVTVVWPGVLLSSRPISFFPHRSNSVWLTDNANMKRNKASFVDATAWEEHRDTFSPSAPSKIMYSYSNVLINTVLWKRKFKICLRINQCKSVTRYREMAKILLPKVPIINLYGSHPAVFSNK